VTEVQEQPRPAKPMSRDDKRDLKKIIESDYAVLQSDLTQQINEAHQAELDEIKRAYSGRQDDLLAASRAVRELAEKFRREYEDLITTYAHDRLVIHNDNRTVLTVQLPGTFRVQGLNEDLTACAAKWQAIAAKARASLRKQESEAQRKVVMVGLVNTEAQAILEGLPNADDIITRTMRDVESAQAPRALGDSAQPA
jgi:tryptophan synthase beta subunit